MEQISLFGEAVRKNILMSIQDTYFERMASGDKKNEYRFSFCEEKVKAFIYIPKTKKHIAGFIDFGEPKWVDAKSACQIYQGCGDGDFSVMDKWLSGKKGCYIIPVEAVYKYKKPISYEELKNEPEFIAPQAYLYLDKKKRLLSILQSREVISVVKEEVIFDRQK